MRRSTRAIFKSSSSFVHGHTYGGNPLSCATALAVQKYIETHDLIARCAQRGELLLEKLKPLEELPMVGEVRGKGLLIGIEFVADKATRATFDPNQGVTSMVVDQAFERGVLVMPGAPGMVDGARGDHIAISPPFTVNEDEVNRVAEVLRESIGQVVEDLNV